jgi:hypothetical protein
MAGLLLISRALSLADCPRGPVLEALTDPFLASCLAREDLLPAVSQVASWLCEDEGLSLEATVAAAVKVLGGTAKELSTADAAELAKIALSAHNKARALPPAGRCLSLVLAAGGAPTSPVQLLVLLGSSLQDDKDDNYDRAVEEVARALARDDEAKFPCLSALARLPRPPDPPQWAKTACEAIRTMLRSKLGPAERAAALVVLAMAVGAVGLAVVAQGDVAFLRLVIGLARVEIAVELERTPGMRNAAAVVACFEIVESFVGALVGDEGDELAALVAPDLAAVEHYRQLLSDIFTTLLAYVADKAENEGQDSTDPILDPALRVLLLWLLDETEAHREAVANVAPFLVKRCLRPGSPLAPIFLRAVPALASSPEVATALSPEAHLIESALQASTLKRDHKELYDDIKDLLDNML